VMALGEEEGGDSLRPKRPSPRRLLPQEQDVPLPEQTSPWWTCALPSTASSIPPGSLRPWSGHVSSSSARWLRTRPTGAARAPRSASSTMCMETHRPSSSVTCATTSPPSSPARSSGRHRRAEAAEGVDRVAEL
jgi:hypothetical protein